MYNCNTDSLGLILGVEVFFSEGHCSGALCLDIFSRGRYSSCAVSVVDTLYVIGRTRPAITIKCVASADLVSRCPGGQVKPVGQESMNLDTVEQLRVGRDQAWVQLPSLLKRRSSHYTQWIQMLRCYDVTMQAAARVCGGEVRCR